MEQKTLPFYPIPVAAKKLGIPSRTLYRWVAEGKVKTYELPGDGKRGSRAKLVMLEHVKDFMGRS